MAQQLAEKLVQKAVKTFTLKDVIKHKKIPFKNLFEICSHYPNFGVGFKVWRKTWPQESFYIIKDIQNKDTRHGNAFGILYWKGKQINTVPVSIRNGNKRGVWKYAINNASCTLDNDMSFTAEDLMNYKTFMEISNKVPDAQTQAKQSIQQEVKKKKTPKPKKEVSATKTQ